MIIRSNPIIFPLTFFCKTNESVRDVIIYACEHCDFCLREADCILPEKKSR